MWSYDNSMGPSWNGPQSFHLALSVDKIVLLLDPKNWVNGQPMKIEVEMVARGRSFMLDGGRCPALKRRGGI